MKTFFALFLFSLSAQALEPSQGRWFDRVLIVVLENRSLRDVTTDPYFKSLLARGAIWENYENLYHPSYPNYIAMVAGDKLVSGDSPRELNVRHLGDLLEDKGLSWKTYAEKYPGNCFLGNSAAGGNYVKRHVPFLSFSNVVKNPARCARVVDASSFAKDWKSGALPEFTLYIPDQQNNGHDSSLSFVSNWLKGFLQPILESPNLARTLVVITYDESSILGQQKLYTIAIGAGVRPGISIAESTDHYGLLRTIEDNFSLGTLGKKDEASRAFPLW